MFVNFCQIIQYSQLHITWQQGGVTLCFASRSHQKYASYKFPLDLSQSNQTKITKWPIIPYPCHFRKVSLANQGPFLG